MTHLIRLASAEDADAILDLTLKAYQPIRDLNIRFSAAHADRELVLHNLTQNATYLLEKNGRIAATVTVRYPWADPGHEAYPFIWWFAVHPDFKQKGIGSALLSYVEEEVLTKQVKAPAVYLATATRHPWLVGIYERRGYKTFKEKVHEGDNIVFLRKILNPSLYELIEKRESITST
ncbi:GNAT family N-acetyltransferase [Domibacillus sp. DTU_2020_1001157_1_SI_ALB_TIR_016]|uniref:GNAT family N-acetyltransferase n=1 Tax=Domibacillus sp. DTU_2020_1001157_1_SI_ALB_TIR_016 TaxID=3077789 RepID=UPI0028EF5610|nr:GNAT family N-acetyltransferase [Domibacillus sp. DTU_2020_1001157_1_SI_ALB_TIR_016]WNS78369.1 GNAT family N-acetyltransferase [Domibacillus sp. DTU_2020_1001157_1_SI_ALB_TIR_016]